MSLQDYRKKIEAEPQMSSGFFLKPQDVKVGDQVHITSYVIDPVHEVLTKGGPVTIPEKIAVTGEFTAVGNSQPTGQEVKVSISKAQAKKLFALWKDKDWVGKKIMVTAVTTKPIKGESRTWIEWTGLP